MDRIRKFLISLFSSLAPFTALAEVPRVHFDMPYSVACRDVSPADYGTLHPGYKLVEAKLDISALLLAGNEKDLTLFFVRVESPQNSLMIADYLPKTSHESLVSKVTTENSTERAAALGINLSGKYELLNVAGPSAGIGQKKTSSVKTELLPPLETVAASGTLARATSVFFKIKSTPRNLLEGTREYALVLNVPANWRADYVRIRCEAEGIRRSMVSSFDEQVTVGHREFLVALHQEGDEGARQLAENFARREAAKAQGNKTTHHARPSESAKRSFDISSPWAALQR
jgi:hypothetical protein